MFDNFCQRLACNRSKGRAFKKQHCVCIVAVKGLLGGVFKSFIKQLH